MLIIQCVSETEKMDQARRIAENQQRLASNLKGEYDFIICGAGASGSVIARRMAENVGATAALNCQPSAAAVTEISDHGHY